MNDVPDHVLSVKDLHNNLLNSNVSSPVENVSQCSVSQSAAEYTNQGEGNHIPEHVSIDVDRTLQQLKESALNIEESSLRDKVITALDSVVSSKSNDFPSKNCLRKGKRTPFDSLSLDNIVSSKRSRITGPVIEEVEEIQSSPSKSNPLEKLTHLKKGMRVSIPTTAFDGNVPGSWSSGKPALTFGHLLGWEKESESYCFVGRPDEG